MAICLASGVPVQKSGIIRKKLTAKEEGSIVKLATDSEGVAAATMYNVLDTVKNTLTSSISLLALQPLTGRTHQLRVHCASVLKTPIVGDSIYGKPDTQSFQELLQNDGSKYEFSDYSVNSRKYKKDLPLQLHAKQIILKHPETKQIAMFDAPLPSYMRNIFSTLGFSTRPREYDNRNINSKYSTASLDVLKYEEWLDQREKHLKHKKFINSSSGKYLQDKILQKEHKISKKNQASKSQYTRPKISSNITHDKRKEHKGVSKTKGKGAKFGKPGKTNTNKDGWVQISEE